MYTNYSKYEPIFGEYYIKETLGEGSYGKVFRIERTEFGTTYSSALKVMSVPKKRDDIIKLKLQGSDPSTYCRSVVEKLRTEVELMAALKGNSNIVSYENHKFIQHEDGIGWDILIQMELLTPLLKHLIENDFNEKDIIELGIDMCKALEICHKHGIIHRDIKPENIFASKDGNYKLGDFGVAKVSDATETGTLAGTQRYMAPEVFNHDKYGAAADTYSLGLVLYMLLDNYKLPFETANDTATEKEIANSKRLAGMQIPLPANGSRALQNVVLMACAYEPKDRFQSAKEMREALEACLRGEEKVKAKVESAKVKEYEKPKEPVTPVKPKTEPAKPKVEPAKVKVEPVKQKAGPKKQTTVEKPVKPLVKEAPATKPKKSGIGKALIAIVAVAVIGIVAYMVINSNSTVPMKSADEISGPVVTEDTSTWDCVYFGNYPQSETGDDGFYCDSIKWRVLSVDGDEAFLLADKVLDYGIPYNEEHESVTWENCTLRKWLNNDFINEAFSSSEEDAIIEKTIKNKDNSDYGTEGVNDTRDKVFLLSIDEAMNSDYGFPSDYDDCKTRKAVTTNYVASKGGNTVGSSESWWLRSSGYDVDFAAYVDDDGFVYGNGYYVHNDLTAARPALYLNLSSNLWEYAGTVSSDGKVATPKTED